jgi:hypothetical protein
MRGVFAGWLGGDQMPMERRLSVDGPGTLPGFGFRTTRTGLDRGNCNVGNAVIGVPAQCDRIALGQIEYRSDLHLPFTGGLEDFPRRYRRSHDDISWVLFADAGRGWLIDRGDGTPSFDRGALPALSTFRTDIGIGLDVMGLGVYCAKALSDPSEPVNFFVRLRHRF